MSGFWQGLSILLSIAADLIGMVVGVYVQLSVSAVSDTASEIVPLESELRASDARINDLATQLKDIQNTLSSLSSIPKEDSISIQLQQVVSGVTELK